MHHCGRSISGANARGSLAKSACCVIGFSCRSRHSPPWSGGTVLRTQSTAGLFHFTTERHHPDRRRAALAQSALDRIVIRLHCLCRLAITLRWGDSNPRSRFERAAEVHHRREQHDDPAFPAVAGIAEGAAERAMFVLLSGSPRSSLVNQTISFFSLSAPWPMSSTVTFLMRSFRSPLMSAARKYFDLSKSDASNMVYLLCMCELRECSGVGRYWTYHVLLFAVAGTAPGSRCDRQIERPGGFAGHQTDEFFGAAEVVRHLATISSCTCSTIG